MKARVFDGSGECLRVQFKKSALRSIILVLYYCEYASLQTLPIRFYQALIIFWTTVVFIFKYFRKITSTSETNIVYDFRNRTLLIFYHILCDFDSQILDII